MTRDKDKYQENLKQNIGIINYLQQTNSYERKMKPNKSQFCEQIESLIGIGRC